MLLTKVVRRQLTVFIVLTIVALAVMGIVFMQIPALAGIGRYTVTLNLPATGGLYQSSNVTYRGTTIGQVDRIYLEGSNVRATLSLDSSIKVPSDAVAEVHSRSAIGEQYVDFLPASDSGPFLEDGDTIGLDRTSIPQDIAPMLDTVERSLTAIPQNDLTTVIDETYRAFNGIGPQVSQLLDSSDDLLRDAQGNVDPTTRLIDDLGPLLNSQLVSSDAIKDWAKNLNSLTAQAKDADQQVRGILDKGAGVADEVTRLFQDMQPTLPIILGNLISLGQVAVTYNPSLEQVLVLLPQQMSNMQTIGIANKGYTDRGFLSFNLNLNAPEPCTTGFLPASDRRDGSAVDSPPRTDDSLYCAVPQDAQVDVRGARNLPCMDVPGKRAPTVDICKSDQQYVPKGTNPWIGNPTPTTDNPLAEQGNAAVPEQSPPTGGTAPASAEKHTSTSLYDERTGQYQGRDGRTYTLTPSAHSQEAPTWQTLITGPR